MHPWPFQIPGIGMLTIDAIRGHAMILIYIWKRIFVDEPGK